MAWHRGVRAAACVGLLGGCVRSLPESEVGEHAVALFGLFEDGPALAERVAQLDEALDDVELDGRRRSRLFDLPRLSERELEGLTVPEGIDLADTMRAAMVAVSRHGLSENLRAQVEENQTCINAEAVACHERVSADGADPADFLDGTVDVYRTVNTIRTETFVADFWVQAPVDFRRIELADGRLAVVGRTWLEEPFDSDNGRRTWTQRFGLDVYIEDPDGADRTRRVYATWAGPALGGLSRQFGVPALRRGLSEGFERPDDWLDDPTCDVELTDCLADAPF